MEPKIALKIAKQGSEWLERCIQDDGRFIYGYDSKTLKKVKGYNILRHLGSLWSMLDVYEVSRNERILIAVINSLEYVDAQYTDSDGLSANIIEDGWVKLGGNGLAVLALLRAYSRSADVDGDHKWMLHRAGQLCNYIAGCVDNNHLFTHHKRNWFTKEDKGFVCEFYPGEALFALASYAMVTNDESLHKFTVDSIKAYKDLREEEGQIRDHWMMQAIETACEFDRAGCSRMYFEIFRPYAKAILDKTMSDAPSKKAGPTACRSECILSYIRLVEFAEGATSETEILDLVVRRQLDFQAESFITRGLSQGAFRLNPTSNEVRNDYCQHNISSFIKFHNLHHNPTK